ASSMGAVAGIAAGLGITIYYMVHNHAWMRTLFGVTEPVSLWWGIQPISAGVFGVPLGFLVIFLVSLFTPAPNKETQELVEHVRYPNLKAAPARA
ncbi:MAG: cation acetate symporter, partial [Aquincola sp.]|nr:cation acetate symporter [Aquincola sp.]